MVVRVLQFEQSWLHLSRFAVSPLTLAGEGGMMRMQAATRAPQPEQRQQARWCALFWLPCTPHTSICEMCIAQQDHLDFEQY